MRGNVQGFNYLAILPDSLAVATSAQQALRRDKRLTVAGNQQPPSLSWGSHFRGSRRTCWPQGGCSAAKTVPEGGRPEDQKENVWNDLVFCIPPNEANNY